MFIWCHSGGTAVYWWYVLYWWYWAYCGVHGPGVTCCRTGATTVYCGVLWWYCGVLHTALQHAAYWWYTGILVPLRCTCGVHGAKHSENTGVHAVYMLVPHAVVHSILGVLVVLWRTGATTVYWAYWWYCAYWCHISCTVYCGVRAVDCGVRRCLLTWFWWSFYLFVWRNILKVSNRQCHVCGHIARWT